MEKAFQILNGEVVLDDSWTTEQSMKGLIKASNILRGYKKDEDTVVKGLELKIEAEKAKPEEDQDSAEISSLQVETVTHMAHYSQFCTEYDIVMKKCDYLQVELTSKAKDKPVKLVEDKSVVLVSEKPRKPQPKHVPDPIEERTKKIKAGLIAQEVIEIEPVKNNRDITEKIGINKPNSGREGMAMSTPGRGTHGSGGDRKSYARTEKENARKGTFKIFKDRPMNNI